jgi:hypothetical protein
MVKRGVKKTKWENGNWYINDQEHYVHGWQDRIWNSKRAK